MGHGESVHGIYIPGETGPSVFVGARMYISADGQNTNAIRGYGLYANATVSDSTLVTTGAGGHGVRLWDRAIAKLVNTSVTVSGAGAFGVYATDNSTIDTTGGTINTTLDSARGIYVDNSVGRLNGTNVNTQARARTASRPARRICPSQAARYRRQVALRMACGSMVERRPH
ncbi:hypothetical protein AWV80_09605 [Cupriavidus sp. UYMU48A]|nr:hypothetical protein AWV80_09605 [Cupriavidus sp. UYMU48A]